MTKLHDLAAHWRVAPKDLDPVETREWLEGFDALLAQEGPERASFILRKLLDHARNRRVALPAVLSTPYANSIGVAEQPQLPGSRLLHGSVDATQKGFWNLYGFGQRTLVQLLDETLIQSLENSTDRTLNAARPMPAEIRAARRPAPADPVRR